ncbi:hypothetical protein TWF481_002171 [Arthrobotrys musiformis]|uniref:Uncharacterized protein n=1 Tax=Arthrobotrys musiformis TaxID=47236 RepID=A0AAV9VUV4_9PEZI
MVRNYLSPKREVPPEEESSALTRGMTRRSMTTDEVLEPTSGPLTRRDMEKRELVKYQPRSASTPPSRELARIPETTVGIADKRSFHSEPDSTAPTPEGVQPKKRPPPLLLNLRREEQEPEPEKPRKGLWPFRRS